MNNSIYFYQIGYDNVSMSGAGDYEIKGQTKMFLKLILTYF